MFIRFFGHIDTCIYVHTLIFIHAYMLIFLYIDIHIDVLCSCLHLFVYVYLSVYLIYVSIYLSLSLPLSCVCSCLAWVADGSVIAEASSVTASNFRDAYCARDRLRGASGNREVLLSKAQGFKACGLPDPSPRCLKAVTGLSSRCDCSLQPVHRFWKVGRRRF